MNDEFRLDTPDDDDPTARLLRGALQREADAVQPSADGLRRIRAEIESRTPHPVTRLARRWTPLVAAAAVLALIATAGGLVLHWRPRGPSQASAASGAIIATMDQAEARTAPAATVPVYVVGFQGGRPVLFREFRPTRATDEQGMIADAVRLALTARPLDPKYTRLFAAPSGTKVIARVTPAQIGLDIAPAPKAVPGVTAAEAQIAQQQLVWTATATAAVVESGPGSPAPSPPTG